MPLPLSVGFIFLVPAHPGSPLNVCVYCREPAEGQYSYGGWQSAELVRWRSTRAYSSDSRQVRQRWGGRSCWRQWRGDCILLLLTFSFAFYSISSSSLNFLLAGFDFVISASAHFILYQPLLIRYHRLGDCWQFSTLFQREGSVSLGVRCMQTLNKITIGSLGRYYDRPVIGGDLVDALVPAL